MATTFTLPELGENIESGTIISVLVSVGDRVEKDQPVIELETDKAVVEVPCPEAGTVAEIRAKEGETLRVGEVILVLNGSPAATTLPQKEIADTPALKAAEATVAAKTVVAPPAEATPPEEPESASRAIEEPEEPLPPEPAPEITPAPTTKKPGTVRAAPSIRRLAREIGVDIYEVHPATPGATITADDVKAYARAGRDPAKQEAPGIAPKRATDGLRLPNFEKWGNVTREKMTNVRRLIAENMSRSWNTIPHVTHNDKADITELEKFRKQYGPRVQAAGGKLTATAILVKVLAEGLKRFPQFNTSVDTANSEIIYKQFYTIGVAVDTEWGLLVPNIKNVDRKSLVDIAVELSGLSERARNRKTTLDELQGTCITITNLGGIGGLNFSPIVNLPEVAILGVSRSKVEPVYIDGEFVPRTMMPLSLSYDHRVIDGADAARFTRWLCEALEQPMLLFLEH